MWEVESVVQPGRHKAGHGQIQRGWSPQVEVLQEAKVSSPLTPTIFVCCQVEFSFGLAFGRGGIGE